jgi:hypothetical protein
MSYVNSAIESVRDGASARAAKLTAKDPLRSRLQQLSQDADQLRSRIVATKEGGMITGEERIRELLGTVYGDVNGHEGRPSETQVTRTDALARELDDVATEFHQLTNKQLTTLNASLQKKKLEPIRVPSEDEWKKQHEEGSSAKASAGSFRERD